MRTGKKDNELDLGDSEKVYRKCVALVSLEMCSLNSVILPSPKYTDLALLDLHQ